MPAFTPLASLRSIRLAQLSDISAQLWLDSDVAVIDLADRGCIIGILFERNMSARLARLPEYAPVGSGSEALARWLVRECWGSYVAILRDDRTGTFDILVDPSGLCPAYSAISATHLLISSHPVLLEEAGAQLPVSWGALRAQLLRPALRQRPTCLTGVTELAPGELTLASACDGRARPLWLPESFMPDGSSLSFDAAASELRELAVSVIGAWAGVFGRIAVAASGGVDSSFICAALARAGASFGCATVATADPSGDERRFVQLLAGHLGVEAMPSIYDSSTIDPIRAVSAGLARPSRKPFMAALEAALFEAAANSGAEIVFDGNGGDNLFCFLHSSAPFVDRLLCDGIGRGAFSTFIDMCRITGCDLPTMARAALRRIARAGRLLPWPADLSLLAEGPDVPWDIDPLTPWFDVEVGRQWGKRDHLALIMRGQPHMHGLGIDGLPRFSPLASQPLVEYCLRMPTWLWCRGGINRALARAAFVEDLPKAILRRTSKAGPDSFIRRSFDLHRDVIRERLMDGLLARHGIIDRQAVDYALAVDAVSSGDDLVLRLLDLAEAENWARSWSN
jgi:asparagine synthase (glutamine-hydrolysing)